MKRIILLISLGCFVLNLFGQGFLKPIDTINSGVVSMNVSEFTGENILFTTNTSTNLEDSQNAKFDCLTNNGESITQFDVDISITPFLFSLDDDSFITIGDRSFPSFASSQINASRYTKDGVLVWSNQYSEVASAANLNRVTGAFQAVDGLLIFGSKVNTLSGSAPDDVFPFLVKVDFDGVLQWEVQIDEPGTFLSEVDQGNFNVSDTIRLVSDRIEYQINMDGNILSERQLKLYEEIDLLDLPFINDEFNTFYFSSIKAKIENGSGEIVLETVFVSTSYYDDYQEKWVDDFYDVYYVSKFDENRNRIWIQEVGIRNDGGVAVIYPGPAIGEIKILPNDNIIYIPGTSCCDILELDVNTGDIIETSSLNSAVGGTFSSSSFELYDVLESDGYYMCVGERRFSKNKIVFIKVGYDLVPFDLEVTDIPIQDRVLSLGSVEALSNGQYAGMGHTRGSTPDVFASKVIYAFRADENGVIFTNEISGNAIGDLNNDCQVDSLDIDLSNWDIIASGTQEFRTTTNQDGSYTMQIDTGEYQLSIIPKNDYWLNCDTTEVEFANFFDTLNNVVLTTSAIAPCSFIEIDVGFGVLRRCFSNRVVVQYCNQGTFAEDSTMVELHIDSYLDVDTTSIPIASQQDTTLFFDIGEVGIGECGKFNIWVTPNCDNAVLGQEHCIDAHVFPDTLCVPQDSLWSGANVVVEAICEGDSTLFNLVNIGNAPTKEDLAYIVIVDDIIVSRDDTYSLAAGESIQFVEYEPGSSVKVIAEQEPFHPLGNQVGVEAFCAGTDFDFISSFNQFDNDPFTDMVCVENRGSFDPNDKSAIPLGAGAEHYISSAQDLEYKIRFQNTGTDTAFTVIIRDTIASELDMSTFAAGIGSHDYTISIEEGNILIFTFDNILLPDSTTNLVESNGFVEFKIDQVDGNLPKTVIENTAAIFFDFNDPIITNTVFHTIETPVVFSKLSVDLCANEMYEQILYTNDTTISVLHASPYLDSFAIVDIHLLPVDSTIQYLNVEYGTTINEDLITMDTTIYEDYTNSFGCDSILVRDITIENVNAVSLVGKSHWEVFPNPTKGSLSITTSQSFTDDIYTVSVMNIVGVAVYEQKHKITPNENLNLDLRNLSAGTYLLNIASKHGMITEKVVINP